MKSKILSIIILIFPLICSAQHTVYFSREDNVYGRGADVILNYAESFIKANDALLNYSESDSAIATPVKYRRDSTEVVVSAVYLMKRTKSFCFSNLIVTADIAFMAKQGRTRLELRNIKYVILPGGGTSTCTGSGDYETVIKSDCCKHPEYIKTYLSDKFTKLGLDWKKELKSRNGGSAWAD